MRVLSRALALGISVLGSIGVALYRGGVSEALPPGVPGEAAAGIRDTLGAAVGIAAQLPDQLGGAVLEVARDAFVRGMVLAAAICAVLAVAVALVALFTLRDVGPAGDAGVTSEPQGAVAGGV